MLAAGCFLLFELVQAEKSLREIENAPPKDVLEKMDGYDIRELVDDWDQAERRPEALRPPSAEELKLPRVAPMRGQRRHVYLWHLQWALTSVGHIIFCWFGVSFFWHLFFTVWFVFAWAARDGASTKKVRAELNELLDTEPLKEQVQKWSYEMMRTFNTQKISASCFPTENLSCWMIIIEIKPDNLLSQPIWMVLYSKHETAWTLIDRVFYDPNSPERLVQKLL